MSRLVDSHVHLEAELSFDPMEREDVRQLLALLERVGSGSLDEILVIASRRTDRIARLAVSIAHNEMGPEGKILITPEWLQTLLRGAYAQGAMDAHSSGKMDR